jgi:hypothetical protein
MRKAIVLVMIAIAVAVSAWYWFLTAHGFSAREQPSAFENVLAMNLRRLATPPEARDLKNPIPATPENIAEA